MLRLLFGGCVRVVPLAVLWLEEVNVLLLRVEDLTKPAELRTVELDGILGRTGRGRRVSTFERGSFETAKEGRLLTIFVPPIPKKPPLRIIGLDLASIPPLRYLTRTASKSATVSL
jgi:hypothetical protein